MGCLCFDDGYQEGYEDGLDTAYDSMDDAGELKMCGICEHWYPDREACYYYPVARRFERCDRWSAVPSDGHVWTPHPYGREKSLP
jgi:hypothetical protein